MKPDRESLLTCLRFERWADALAGHPFDTLLGLERSAVAAATPLSEEEVDEALVGKPAMSETLLGADAIANAALEVRAFFNDGGGPLREDPLTGSLNAWVAQWLTSTGRVKAPYVARQGARVGRDGRVHLTGAEGDLWIGGSAVVTVSGSVEI